MTNCQHRIFAMKLYSGGKFDFKIEKNRPTITFFKAYHQCVKLCYNHDSYILCKTHRELHSLKTSSDIETIYRKTDVKTGKKWPKASFFSQICPKSALWESETIFQWSFFIHSSCDLIRSTYSENFYSFGQELQKLGGKNCPNILKN